MIRLHQGLVLGNVRVRSHRMFLLVTRSRRQVRLVSIATALILVANESVVGGDRLFRPVMTAALGFVDDSGRWFFRTTANRRCCIAVVRVARHTTTSIRNCSNQLACEQKRRKRKRNRWLLNSSTHFLHFARRNYRHQPTRRQGLVFCPSGSLRRESRGNLGKES